MQNSKQLAPVGATVAIKNGKHKGWYAIVQKYCPVMVKVVVVDKNGQQAKTNIYLRREALDLHTIYTMDPMTGQYQKEQTGLNNGNPTWAEATIVDQVDHPRQIGHGTPGIGEMVPTTPAWTVSQRARMAATDDPALVDGLKTVINRMATLGIDTKDGVQEVVQIAMKKYRPSMERSNA